MQRRLPVSFARIAFILGTTYIATSSSIRLCTALHPVRPRTGHSVVATSAKRGGASKPARGRTTSADERSLAELLQRKLHKLGLDRARVTAVATKPGHESDLRFEHIPVSKIDALKQAIGR